MRLLAISGSLRAQSSNSRLIEALAHLASPGDQVVIYRGLGSLPHFNPDLDDESPPAPVLDLRREVGLCDALVICSPEYAHGVAGAMKNALDWLVRSLEFSGTPVALINAAPRASHAQSQMRETLLTMDAAFVEAASIAVPIQGGDLSPAEIAAQTEIGAALRAALDALAAASRAVAA
jgi:NAD(P)H-dependent FMN reductase